MRAEAETSEWTDSRLHLSISLPTCAVWMASGNAVAPFRMCDNDPPTHSSPITEPPMSSSAQPSSRAHRPNFSGTRLVCNDKKLTVFSSLLPRKPQTATKRVKPLTLFVCVDGGKPKNQHRFLYHRGWRCVVENSRTFAKTLIRLAKLG